MEISKDIQKRNKILLIYTFIMIAISFIILFGDLFNALKMNAVARMLHISLDLVMLLFIIVYVLFGYKKPHGHMLRYIFIIFALYLVITGLISHPTNEIIISRSYFDTIIDAGTGIAAVIAAYVGGRLRKREQNKVLMIIAGIILLISVVVANLMFADFSIQRAMGLSVKLFVWIDLCLAHFARYDEHQVVTYGDK